MMFSPKTRQPLAVLLALALIRPPISMGASLTDPGWPRQVTQDGATLVYYQPQVDQWTDYKQISGRVAFSLTPAVGKQAMGVASLTANTIVDKEARTVYFRDIQVTSVRFPSLEGTAAEPMEALFRKLMPQGGEPISLDRLMADVNKSNVAAKPVLLNNDPPQVFFTTVPAILLMVEGEPVLAPIEKLDLQFVVNTNWNLFFDKKEKSYYLLAEKVWLQSQQLAGPWARTTKLPKEMSKLPAQGNWTDVLASLPASSAGQTPDVFFSTKPAELLMLRGAPIYSRIIGTKLLYVANTDSDIFLDSMTNEYYILLSGRWFRGKDLKGPWTFSSDMLPEDFKKIPRTSPKARVLSSVPGTVEASDAVLLAQIPTTAIINKADAEKAVKVNYYGGEPEFKPIEGTTLQYAVNTQDKVIQVGLQYYVCYNAVWFVSSNANGPWIVANTVPQEIYSIPPSSPMYNVTYVTQTVTATTVESSAAAGYLGMFVMGAAVGACVAYGTGFYYPPYAYFGPAVAYPIYHPWPMTYGAGAVYNPWTGGYAVGHRAYGPYGAAGSSAWYNPATGRYGRSASVQGWYGGRTVASSYNPWTGAYGATSQGHNAYAQWGQSAAVRGNQWAQTGHISTANGTLAGYRGSGGQGAAYRGQNGTVARGTNGTYAGADGNVYRKDSSGSWSKYDNGSWNSVDTSQARERAQSAQGNLSGANRDALQSNRGSFQSVDPQTMRGLNQSWQSRERGAFQSQSFQGFRGGGFGGGGFRGGGFGGGGFRR